MSGNVCCDGDEFLCKQNEEIVKENVWEMKDYRFLVVWLEFFCRFADQMECSFVRNFLRLCEKFWVNMDVHAIRVHMDIRKRRGIHKKIWNLIVNIIRIFSFICLCVCHSRFRNKFYLSCRTMLVEKFKGQVDLNF